jgi:amino acid transporter
VAIIFTSSLCALLVLVSDLTTLAATTVTLLLLAFAAVNVAVMVLRKDRSPISTSPPRPCSRSWRSS